MKYRTAALTDVADTANMFRELAFHIKNTSKDVYWDFEEMPLDMTEQVIKDYIENEEILKNLEPIIKDKKGLIFDVDGTLLDSMPMWKRLDVEYLSSLGLIPESDFQNKVKMMTMLDAARYINNYFGLDKEPEVIAKEIQDIVYSYYENELLIKKGAFELLAELKKYNEEDEIKLIQDLFTAFNSFKPDFALAWNMGFDIPYIIARIQRLGYDPAEIMSHKDFKYKVAEYYVDERNKSEFAERGDFAQISSYTIFLDQMIQFASRRKGQNKFISFTLDYIGTMVAGVKKLDYKNITTNISELPYKDYKTFVFYNIMDTIVQYCIERMTADIDYLFNKCNINNTRYSKGHRQTVYLTNRGIKEFYNTDNGYIMGNNVNKYNSKPDEKFPGAFVADPLQLSNYSKMRINGKPINVLENLDDFDLKIVA